MSSPEIGAALNQLIHEMSNALSGNLIPALNEMTHKFDQEDQRVTDWSNDVHHALEETQQAWKAFTATAMEELHEAGATVEATLPDVEQNAHQYDQKLAEAQAEIGTVSANYAEHASQLTDHLGALGEHHLAMEHEVEHHLTEWSGNVTGMLHTMDEHRAHITDAYDHVTHQVASHVEDIGAHIQSASGMVNEHVSAMVTHHASAVADLLHNSKDHLISHVGEALGGVVGESMSALEGFMHTGEELGHAFDGGLGDVLGVVESVAGIVDGIKPVIELAESI